MLAAYLELEEMSTKRKRSAAWTYFDVEDGHGTDPACSLCGETVRTSGNTSNMIKHLKNKHEEAYREVNEQQEEAKRLKAEKPSKKHRQITLSSSIQRAQGYGKESPRRKKIDEALVRMLAVDLQPATIVEDRGFLSLLQVIDPKYQPPSRRTIMRSLLPELYENVKQELKAKLSAVKFCALTTDLWTSIATQGFMTVTCHFLSSDWVLQSAVLSTIHVGDAHTAENLAAELMSITDKWQITEKVACAITDNASNIVAAVRLNGWKHLPCFAHTLNLIVQDSLKADTQLAEVQKKCRNIVSYFHRSSKATDKLVSIQTRLKIENNKLIQDVETRWNSVFYMFQRLIEQHEAVTTTLCLLDKNNLCLSNEDVLAMKGAVTLLKPFEEATTEISADQYLTVSKVIPLARSLQQLTSRAVTSIKLRDELCSQMHRRFTNMESNHFLAAATLLDPRLKKIAFGTTGAAEQCVRRLTGEMQMAGDATVAVDEPSTAGDGTAEPVEGLWGAFDQQVASATSRRTPTSEALVEMRQYLQHPNLDRKEDPLLWWGHNNNLYPQLQQLALKYLCIPATSVPAERLFSKAGELISTKRNRLKPKNVDIFLFLNKNI